jgi:hypothetical protein
MAPDVNQGLCNSIMSKLISPWSELASNDASGSWLELDRLNLSLRHSADECWLEYSYINEINEQDGQRSAGPQQSMRFLLSNGTRPVQVSPQLADRPVVTRPLVPTELLRKEKTTLLVSTVLWARVSIGEQTLAELPTLRLSDTWFGANTQHGELCYATQTRARLRMDNVQNSPFRAITPITISNEGEDNLKLERINVPVPHLTLYCDGERFWTSALTVIREENLATAKLHIEASPPTGAVAVAQPRRPIRGGVFDRAVDLLFA